MNPKIQSLLGLSGIVALIAIAAASLWYVQSFSESQQIRSSFQVQGEGKVIAVPDVAQITFGVITEGGVDITGLQQKNAEKVNRAISFLKDKGIDDKDIKTQYYNIFPRHQYFSCSSPRGSEAASCPPPEIVGYTVSQNVQIKIRDLEKIGDLLAGIVQRGANTVSGPTFTVDDPDTLQNEARSQAIIKAREKAEAIAKAGGFRLGKLVALQEGFVSPIPYYGLETQTVGMAMKSGGPELEPGSQEVRVTVTLTYEIL